MSYARIIRDLSIDGYHSDKEHTSHSRIRDFAERGPAFYRARHITGEIEREETDALRVGQASEVLVQGGGEALAAAYAVRPAHLDGRTKEGKAWAAANASRPQLTDDEYRMILAMNHAIQSAPELEEARRRLARAEMQVTLRGELHGVPVQARPDWAGFDDIAPFIVDYKTTKNMNDLLQRIDEAGPSLHRLGYHSQAALAAELMRQNGYPDCACYLLVAEKTALYPRVAFLDITELVPAGRRFLDETVPRLADCMQRDYWPLAPRGVVRVKCPRWLTEEQPAA